MQESLPLQPAEPESTDMDLSSASDRRGWLRASLPALLAVALPILLPTAQMAVYYRLWNWTKEPIDTKRCRNYCWDTFFKGHYERGIGRYKHVYFNATWETFLIWATTVCAIVAAYEAAKYVFECVLKGRCRYSLLLVLTASLYAHFYSWWALFNYLNDDFFVQLLHQTVFSVTEVVVTAQAFAMLDRRQELAPKKLLVIVSLSSFHLLAAGSDQLFWNVVRMRGELHQVLRDVAFALPDAASVAVATLELRRLAGRRGVNVVGGLLHADSVVIAAVAAALLWTVVNLL